MLSRLNRPVLILQVVFDTAAAGADPAEAAVPVSMQMHGSDGVTSPLQFDIARRDGLCAFDCTALAVGELNQLMVWLDPSAVRAAPIPSAELCIKEVIHSNKPCNKTLLQAC